MYEERQRLKSGNGAERKSGCVQTPHSLHTALVRLTSKAQPRTVIVFFSLSLSLSASWSWTDVNIVDLLIIARYAIWYDV
jgi:hypothetical protein